MYQKAIIRTARSDDRSLLFSEAKALFGGHPAWRSDRTLNVLEHDTVFVAEVDASIAGFVALSHEPPAMAIDELLVCLGHEQEQVETQLLAYAEGYAISQEARTLRVIVERENPGARQLYSRAGFAPVGDELLERSLATL